MNREEFWKIIDDAKKKSGTDLEKRYDILVATLAKYPPQEILKFRNISGIYVGTAEENLALWGACKAIEGYASDDTFLYFCCWLVSQGKNVYFDAMENPDTLADTPDIKNYREDGHTFEMLMSAPFDAYEEKTGESLYEMMSDPEEVQKMQELDIPLADDEIKELLSGLIIVDDSIFRESEEVAKRSIPIHLPKLTQKFAYDPEADLSEIAEMMDPETGMDKIRENLRAAGLDPDMFPEFAPQPQPANIGDYSTVWLFNGGLAAVEKDGKWGFIDENGKEVIPLKYEMVASFSVHSKVNDITLAQSGGKYGYINKQGVELTPFKYDIATIFDPQEHAWVQIDGKYGFVDRKGTEIVPLKYDELNFGHTKIKGRIGDKWEEIIF